MRLDGVKFGYAAPTFAGFGDTHIDTPCLERITFDVIRDAAVTAEKLGFHSVWVPDHLILARRSEIFEGWTTLSALAGVTSRVKLGTLVVNTLLRHPGLLAKMASTLDNVSNGRLYLGLGSGSIPKELDAYGFEYPQHVGDRVKVLEETIDIMKKLWSGEPVTYNGMFKMSDSICTPRPVQKPHPPILIGALSDSTFVHRAVARYADMYNTIGTTEDFSRRLGTLKEMCSQEKRDFSKIVTSLDAHVLIGKNEKEVEEMKNRITRCSPNYPAVKWKSLSAKERMTWEDFEQFNFVGTPQQLVEKFMKYVDVGCDYFMLWFLDIPDHHGLKLFAKSVMPVVQSTRK